MSGIMISTRKAAIDAYGGEKLWTETRSIEAEISVKGLAFIMKMRPYFNRVTVYVDVHTPYCKIIPIGSKEGIAGVLCGQNVWLENARGEVIAKRDNARASFNRFRQAFFWDDLDMAYFANYAIWNYLALPALLLRRDILWRESRPGVLDGIFPDDLPSHCRKQRFHFDPETGLLRQHDYTAEVIGRFAHAAHIVLEHGHSDGVVYTAHRRVTPRKRDGTPAAGPTLIDIRVHRLAMVNDHLP